MASKLQELGLKLNIPPFLGKRKKLQTADVQDTQLIVHNHIHVERAIGKVRNFHIFDRNCVLYQQDSSSKYGLTVVFCQTFKIRSYQQVYLMLM